MLVVSSPQGASVFTDDAFAGLAVVGKPISLAKPNWFKKVQTDGRQLRVRKVPYDNIQLGLSGIPVCLKITCCATILHLVVKLGCWD